MFECEGIFSKKDKWVIQSAVDTMAGYGFRELEWSTPSSIKKKRETKSSEESINAYRAVRRFNAAARALKDERGYRSYLNIKKCVLAYDDVYPKIEAYLAKDHSFGATFRVFKAKKAKKQLDSCKVDRNILKNKYLENPDVKRNFEGESMKDQASEKQPNN